MLRPAKLLCFAAMIPLAACWSEGDDKSAEDVEAAFENTAEQYEKAAENASGATEERLEDTAEVYREAGEAAADAVDKTDLNVNAQ